MQVEIGHFYRWDDYLYYVIDIRQDNTIGSAIYYKIGITFIKGQINNPIFWESDSTEEVSEYDFYQCYTHDRIALQTIMSSVEKPLQKMYLLF